MLWVFTFLNALQPRRRFFFSGGGHLGFGQPFCNAFKLVFPERPVVNFCGDGAFGMTLQELETAARHNLPVVHVINNDGGWGMCKAGQLAFDSGKPAVLDVSTQLVPHPMFGVMAQVVFQGVPLSMPDGPPPGA